MNAQQNLEQREAEQHAANLSQQSNDQVAEFGVEAIKAWQRGTKALGTGDQLAVYALMHAWEEVTFLAVITDKKGIIEQQFGFDLEEYVTKPMIKADGTRDNKATLARTVAICKRVFGIEAEDVDNSIKQRITRALEVVAYIQGQGFSVTDLEISKGGRLSVPYVVINDEPKEDASENDKKMFKAMAGETVELDGKKGRTIAELQRRAKPKTERIAQANNADKGADFFASVKFARSVLERLLDEEAWAPRVGTMRFADGEPIRKRAYSRLGGHALPVLLPHFLVSTAAVHRAMRV